MSDIEEARKGMAECFEALKKSNGGEAPYIKLELSAEGVKIGLVGLKGVEKSHLKMLLVGTLLQLQNDEIYGETIN